MHVGSFSRSGLRGDGAVSNARHIEEFRRQGESLVRIVQELGLRWISYWGTTLDLESTGEKWLWDERWCCRGYVALASLFAGTVAFAAFAKD